jgi:hypothetical protein
VILILGAIVFGQRWIGAADPFKVYASTLPQMSIFRRVGDQMRLANPLAGLNAWHAPPLRLRWWQHCSGVPRSTASPTPHSHQTVQNSTAPATLWGTGGLLTMIIIVFVSFSLGRSGWVATATAATAYPGSWWAPCYRSSWVMG